MAPPMHRYHVMKTFLSSLAPEHRVIARDLWQALYHAPTQNDLAAARLRFDTAPLEVRQAILKASVQNWDGKTQREIEVNPFD